MGVKRIVRVCKLSCRLPCHPPEIAVLSFHAQETLLQGTEKSKERIVGKDQFVVFIYPVPPKEIAERVPESAAVITFVFPVKNFIHRSRDMFFAFPYLFIITDKAEGAAALFQRTDDLPHVVMYFVFRVVSHVDA